MKLITYPSPFFKSLCWISFQLSSNSILIHKKKNSLSPALSVRSLPDPIPLKLHTPPFRVCPCVSSPTWSVFNISHPSQICVWGRGGNKRIGKQSWWVFIIKGKCQREMIRYSSVVSKIWRHLCGGRQETGVICFNDSADCSGLRRFMSVAATARGWGRK